jgi:hypothetical protein
VSVRTIGRAVAKIRAGGRRHPRSKPAQSGTNISRQLVQCIAAGGIRAWRGVFRSRCDWRREGVFWTRVDHWRSEMIILSHS